MTDLVKKIENDLLAKYEFLQLHKLLNRFNIFEATDMGRREIKHTKFLSYLLDPNESHGLGEVFIKNFITRLSGKIENFPRVLDLDFAFAEIESELKIADETNHSLDCFIKIPLRGQTKKFIHIAIENKINSKQGSDQLSTYTKFLERYEPEMHKIFLTFHEEEPNDGKVNEEEPDEEVGKGKAEKKWKNVTYKDIVLPSVQLTIELIEDTGSANLKAALYDYIELLMEDEDGDKEKELLANHLVQNSDIKKYFSYRKSNRKSHFGDMYIKHKKVVDYMCQLDSDVRTPCLEWWNEIQGINQNIQNEKYGQELIFKYEKSERSYLRFSVLTELNRERLLELNKESKDWLTSKCPIAFEVVIRRLYEKSKSPESRDDSESGDEKVLLPVVNCQLVLTLGPLDADQNRSKLLNLLYTELYGSKSKQTLKDENFEGVWNRLISTRTKEYAKGKSTDTDKPLVWINENVLTIKDGVIELNDWIIDLSIKLNKALDKYFKSPSIDLNQ